LTLAFHLWWERHDGMRGHVFLRNEQMAALRDELLAQGMVCGEAGGPGIPLSQLQLPRNQYIPAIQIEEALDVASPEAVALEDTRLWLDFLVFLEGAVEHGGLRIKP
jgi:hypothetical protein